MIFRTTLHSSRFWAALRAVLTAVALIAAVPAAMAQVPAPPDAVSITAIGDQTITLVVTQSDSTNFDHFICAVSSDSGVTWPPTACTQTGSTAPSYTLEIAGLTNGTIYQVQVAAASALDAPSAFTTAVESARPVANEGPGAPTVGSPTSPAAGGLSITWTAPTDLGYGDPFATAVAASVLRYEYRQKESSNPVWGGAWLPVAPNPSNPLLELSGLTSSTNYDVEIRAVNNLGKAGLPLALDNLLPAGPPPPPGGNTQAIPTLGEWGILILSLLLAASIMLTGRRRRG